MDLSINIKLDNDAFAGTGLVPELRRALEQIVRSISLGGPEGRVFDSNGNSVGSYRLNGPNIEDEEGQ